MFSKNFGGRVFTAPQNAESAPRLNLQKTNLAEYWCVIKNMDRTIKNKKK